MYPFYLLLILSYIIPGPLSSLALAA